MTLVCTQARLQELCAKYPTTPEEIQVMKARGSIVVIDEEENKMGGNNGSINRIKK